MKFENLERAVYLNGRILALEADLKEWESVKTDEAHWPDESKVELWNHNGRIVKAAAEYLDPLKLKNDAILEITARIEQIKKEIKTL